MHTLSFVSAYSMVEDKNIIKELGRYFIDISYMGCGSACSYCYVKTAKSKQKLIKQIKFLKSVNNISKDQDYIIGKNGSIISLCPNFYYQF